jgi:hypothetical protein
VLSRLDDRIRAMKSWRYWSLVGMLAAVIVGALVVITSRVLVGPVGPVRPIGPPLKKAVTALRADRDRR